MSFTALDPQNHQGETNVWLTPLPLVRSLGDFDLDPCAFPNHHTAHRLITLPRNGLVEPWNGRVFLNPPYGKETVRWLEKLYSHGDGIALVFARTDTTWFQRHFELASATKFLSGRIKFLNSNFETSSNAGTGSALLAYGRHNARMLRSCSLKGVVV